MQLTKLDFLKAADHIEKYGLMQNGAWWDTEYKCACVMGALAISLDPKDPQNGLRSIRENDLIEVFASKVGTGRFWAVGEVVIWSDSAPNKEAVIEKLREFGNEGNTEKSES